MKCEGCNNDHDGTYGSGRFCSRTCANTRSHSDNTKRKIASSVKRAHNEGRAASPRKVLSSEAWEEIYKQRNHTYERKLLEADFVTLVFERQRKRILLEQEHKCAKCGIMEWFGQPIPLEVDHKDGDGQNNERNNLEALCPNCHSLTDTWRGRNKNKKRTPVSEEQMVRTFLETGNIRQCLLQLGLAAKGKNYGRVKRALTLWNIEY